MLSSTKTIAIVPARAGSKGLARKNFLSFAGKPLYAHAIAQGMRLADSCILSSDDDTALTIADPKPSHRHLRPAGLAADDTPMDMVLADVITHFKLWDETIVLLQPTSPLRPDQLIIDAINLHKNGSYDLVLGASIVDSSVLKCGFSHGDQFAPVNAPSFCFANRQSLPPLYKPNGSVFVFTASWFVNNRGLACDNIGMVKLHPTLNIDIDNRDDFNRAEAAFQQQRHKITHIESHATNG